MKMNYHDWLVWHVMDGPAAANYSRLLDKLDQREFTYSIPHDENRAIDGLLMRGKYEFFLDCKSGRCDEIPCTILEMMVALAVRCENTMMSNSDYGDRTCEWFHYMLKSLGVLPYTNKFYSDRKVDDIITRFLNHEYSPDGNGGLFEIENPPKDLRETEIWYQMSWYLNQFV